MQGDCGFNVGDRVVIREWEDMAAEYRVERDRIYVGDGLCFIGPMRNLCGCEATVTEVFFQSGYTRLHLDIPGVHWRFSPGMLRYADQNAMDYDVDQDKCLEFLSDL